jgi:hypothetical protein
MRAPAIDKITEALTVSELMLVTYALSKIGTPVYDDDLGRDADALVARILAAAKVPP